MVTRRAARSAFGLLALVGAIALLLQLVLVVSGASALIPGQVPPLGHRLLQFIGYFTIQSNILVLITAITLARRPDRDGPAWRVLRLDALVGITITGLVHFFLLRPLLDLHGGSYVADKLLHLVVPALAVLTWLIFGPRMRITVRTGLWAMLWPLAWTAVILVVGWITGWYPYPFLNAHQIGGGAVALYCVGIFVLFVAVFGLSLLGDRKLPRDRSVTITP